MCVTSCQYSIFYKYIFIYVFISSSSQEDHLAGKKAHQTTCFAKASAGVARGRIAGCQEAAELGRKCSMVSCAWSAALCVYMYMYKYIYICIWREREREIDREKKNQMNNNMHAPYVHQNMFRSLQMLQMSRKNPDIPCHPARHLLPLARQ